MTHPAKSEPSAIDPKMLSSAEWHELTRIIVERAEAERARVIAEGIIKLCHILRRAAHAVGAELLPLFGRLAPPR